MRKKLQRLIILNCVLLTLPGLTAAAETVPDSSEAVTLQGVEVTATPLEKYLVTASVITDKDIEAKGAKNLAEVLEDVPGLNLHFGRKNNTALDIRGITGTDTKIFIDGMLVNPLSKITSSSSLDLNMFPVDNIAKIEVIKGPTPVIYGTDVAGGAILITTKKGKDYQGGKVSVSGGSYSTRNGAVAYGGGNEKFNYYFNGGLEHTDGFRDNTDKKSEYFNTKLDWKLTGNSSLTFTGGYSNTDKGVSNGVDPATGRPIYYKGGFWPYLNNWQFRDWEKSNLSLEYANKANSKLDYNIKVYQFTEKNAIWANGVDSTSPTNPTSYDKTRWNASYWDSTLKGVEFQSNIKLNTVNTLTFGTLYNDIDWKKSNSALSDPDNYTWQSYKNKRYGYYLQDNFLPNAKTTVTLGIRYNQNEVINSDNQSKKDSSTDPTINVVYQLDSRNTLRGSFGKTCGFPTVEQLYGGTKGNAALQPEKGENYELGFKHTFDQSLTGDIAFFKNDITNKIDIDSNTKTFKNITRAKIRGVELELNKKFSDRFNGFVNYTYLDTTAFNANGSTNDLTYTPRNHVNYGFSYQADKGYKFKLTGHWVSSRYTGDSINDTRTEQTTLYSRLPGYHVLDLEVRRQVNAKQDWYITIGNIFDKQYDSELFYPAAGRSVLVGTDFKF